MMRASVASTGHSWQDIKLVSVPHRFLGLSCLAEDAESTQGDGGWLELSSSPPPTQLLLPHKDGRKRREEGGEEKYS